jgi:rhodanese-related sulfurtransferase
MKKVSPLLASLCLVSIALGQGAANAPASKAHVLSNTELDALLAQPAKILLIDVRRPDEVSSVGGFPVYLSIQLGDLEKDLGWIPKDRTLITVSNHAGRAKKAADLLAGKGFKVAGAAGAETYEKDGGKWVTRIAIPPKSAPSAAGT